MTRLSRWVRITPDGVAEVRVGKVELGQGILTALRQLAADELALAPERIRMLPAHTTHGPDEGLTAGSMSIAQSGPALRLVCANVRALFEAEAARRGMRQVSYAELADAVDLDVEARDLPLIPERRVVGTNAPRLDLPDKVAGRPRFLTDLRPPGLLHGRVVRPPVPGADLISLSEVDFPVVRYGSFLGVVGENEAWVVRAAERLRAAASWTYPALSEPDLRAGPHETIAVATEEPLPGRRLRATYSRPCLAHASIAPSCGLARWEPDGTLSVWSHSQGIHRLRDAMATALAMDPASVSVQHTEHAGSYGHNGADDAAFDAVLLARTVPGRPVLVTWTRHDELTWSPLGSAMTADVTATLDETGRISSWTYDVWSQGHVARPGYAGSPGLLATYELGATRAPSADPPLPAGGTARNALPPYDVGPRRITGHRLLDSPIRTSSLRSLGAYLNVFAIESFMDELALAAGRDPLEFRLAHLPDPRAREVLRAAATDWGTHLPEHTGRGIAFARYKNNGAYCAVVAEVEAAHYIRVRRLTIAADVGQIVNPDGVRNQLEGGATQSTSWTLKERARIGASVDWETYPILRFSEAPEIYVELIDSTEPSVGAGEAAQGPTAAAIANALTNALGVRVRDLPLTREAILSAIESTR